MYDLMSNNTVTIEPSIPAFNDRMQPTLLNTIQLSTDDRIESLERELFQLKGRRSEPKMELNVNKEAQPKKTRLLPEVVIPKIRKPPPQQKAPTPNESTAPDERSNIALEPPIHPYADAQDGAMRLHVKGTSPDYQNLGFGTGNPKPAVFPKRVSRVQVR
jgi:hypothetical protein